MLYSFEELRIYEAKMSRVPLLKRRKVGCWPFVPLLSYVSYIPACIFSNFVLGSFSHGVFIRDAVRLVLLTLFPGVLIFSAYKISSALGETLGINHIFGTITLSLLFIIIFVIEDFVIGMVYVYLYW